MTYVAKLALENWHHFLLMNIGQYSLKQCLMLLSHKSTTLEQDIETSILSVFLFCFHIVRLGSDNDRHSPPKKMVSFRFQDTSSLKHFLTLLI